MYKYTKVAFACLLCLVMAQASMSAVYVDPTSRGPAHNGKSWTTAFLTIQSAVNSLPYGGDVWIKAGVYRERVVLKRYVKLYGGFKGSETAMGQRVLGAYPTVIDAGRLGRGIDVPVNAWCTIDGFVVRQGFADKGGGIYCRTNSNTKILNCRIENCEARGMGGGICFEYYAMGEMTNCFIGYNTATHGGGVLVEYHSYPKLRGVVVARNLATISGGGLYCPFHSGADLGYCTLAFNTAGASGGGACIQEGSAAKLTYSIIAFNSAPVGGGIYGGGRSSQAYLNRCDIYGNTGGNLGGAIPPPLPYLGIFSSDPRFVAPEVDNYRLAPGSPCVKIGAFP